MGRAEFASLALGWVADTHGEAQASAGVLVKNLDGSNATHWSAITGGSSTSGSISSNSDGTVPRYLPSGSYDVTVGATTRRMDVIALRENWDPVARPVPTTTTPERAQIQCGGIFNESGGGGTNYLWQAVFYAANPGTAPVTGALFKTYGQTPAGLNSFAEALGSDAVGYGAQFGVGEGSSQAVVTSTSGSAVLTVTSLPKPGSRFSVGNPITASAGIPGATTITQVNGTATPTDADMSNPSTITMSANASATGSRTVTVQGSGTQQTFGVFVTGTGGNDGGKGNPNGYAFHVQSYTSSEFSVGYNLGASALLSTGTGFRIASATATRAFSIESCALTNGLNVSGSNTFSGGIISIGGATAPSAINITSSNTFSTAAIVLSGQDIATDTTTGMKIATVSTQKIGFYGKTPIVRPTATAAATDAATTQTLANGIRTALINLGLWA